MKHAGSSAANKIVPIVNVQDSEKLVIQKILVIVPLQKNQTNKHQQKKTMLLVLVEKWMHFSLFSYVMCLYSIILYGFVYWLSLPVGVAQQCSVQDAAPYADTVNQICL